MEGYTQSRRDDLESLGFTLMYLVDKKAITWGELTKVPEIIPLKREFLVAETIPDQFFYIRKFIRITSGMQHEDDPDYDAFAGLIDKIFDQVKENFVQATYSILDNLIQQATDLDARPLIKALYEQCIKEAEEEAARLAWLKAEAERKEREAEAARKKAEEERIRRELEEARK
jgi:hypothetical protein